MSRLGFRLEAEAPDSNARAGRFRTLHGEVLTPVFMPVGTQATVRNQPLSVLESCGASVLLANTLHLLRKPGKEVFGHFGGIHRFMGWSGSVLTDSGGYQIFSLAGSRQMTEDGAVFVPPGETERILLSPEASIGAQKAIGSDIMMVLDQCVPSTCGREEALAAMDLTHRWAERSLRARGDSPQSLFGIVQGACFEDLRRQSASAITSLPFDGFAIGGLAVGEGRQLREDMTELTAALLPRHLPRYLMGVGTPVDLLEAVHRGVDMFDCIIPTAYAGRGVAFTWSGKIRISRSVYRLSEEPIEPGCPCEACRRHTRGYLHHLFKAQEPAAWHLLGAHNLYFYQRLMSRMRESVLDGTFAGFRREHREPLARLDRDHPPAPPRAKRRRRENLVLGAFEVHFARDGSASIADRRSGEVMHPGGDPSREARALYIDQPGIMERLRTPAANGEASRKVVWDVGLGAAINAMAAIRACEAAARTGSGTLSPLLLISFERDLDALRLAMRHAPLFPHLHHPGPAGILEHGRWEHPVLPIRWSLLEGDFLSTHERAEPPDWIFHDPFSPKTDGPLWAPDTFRRILRACGTRPAHSPAELFTYSGSTAVRASLLIAGFFVAYGAPTDLGKETTVALSARPGPGSAYRLLGTEWLRRLERSTAGLPDGVRPELLKEHPQFRSS